MTELQQEFERYMKSVGYSERRMKKSPDGSYVEILIQSKWEVAQHFTRWADRYKPIA